MRFPPNWGRDRRVELRKERADVSINVNDIEAFGGERLGEMVVPGGHGDDHGMV
jgi:hypothetical protein